MEYICHYASPLGGLLLSGEGSALTGLWFDGQKCFASTLSRPCQEGHLPVFEDTVRWLDLYFRGQAPDFTPPLAPRGSAFRKAVWDVLLTIPYGQTMTYGQIAALLEEQRGPGRVSPRAVGGAVGHNPISLLIPCHRVVGAGGRLTGYAGGLEKKKALLALEGSLPRGRGGQRRGAGQGSDR